MVAGDEYDRQVDPPKPISDPAAGVGCDVLVLPKITADCHDVDAPLDSEIETTVKGVPQLAPARTCILEWESDEWAIEMDVSDMQDLGWGAKGQSARKVIVLRLFQSVERAISLPVELAFGDFGPPGSLSCRTLRWSCTVALGERRARQPAPSGVWLRQAAVLPEVLLEDLDDLCNDRVRGVTRLLVLFVARLKIGVLLPGVAVRSRVVGSAKRSV